MFRSQASPFQTGKLDPGTELIVEQRGYRHHGIYVGDGLVIHYAGWVRYPSGLVEEISLADFAGRRPVRIGREPAECLHGADIVQRARSRLGERCYDLFRNNCEHFCNWCQVGESTSSQVDLFMRRIAQLARAVCGLCPRLSAPVAARRFSKTGHDQKRNMTRTGRDCGTASRWERSDVAGDVKQLVGSRRATGRGGVLCAER